MQVLFADSVHPLLSDRLSAAGFTCVFDYETPAGAINAKYPDVHGIVIRSRFKIEKEHIIRWPQLKFIARAGAGLENIDLVAAQESGVLCLHAPEGNRTAVSEHALGMLLSLFNNLSRADGEVRKGQWRREANRGHELTGKSVGVIGYGNTGSEFCKRLAGFEVNLLAYDKYKSGFGTASVKEVSLEDLLLQAEVISLHVPLTKETQFMVDTSFIGRVARPFWLINTSRGKVVKTDDLVEGISSGKVLGACLDVLEYESVSFENIGSEQVPEAFRFLAESDKVLLSPHVAGWTFESHRRISEVLADKILSKFA